MWANAARLPLGSKCRTGCINQLVNGWQRENLPHFLFSCWVSLTGDFPKMNNTSSPFNLESSHNEAFPISRLSRATSTVRLNSKLWWTNVRMRLLRHAQSYFKWVQYCSSYLLVHIISEDQKNDFGKGPVKYFSTTQVKNLVPSLIKPCPYWYNEMSKPVSKGAGRWWYLVFMGERVKVSKLSF